MTDIGVSPEGDILVELFFTGKMFVGVRPLFRCYDSLQSQ